jgi:hypothetical protein
MAEISGISWLIERRSQILNGAAFNAEQDKVFCKSLDNIL